jgi:hypothetical protein
MNILIIDGPEKLAGMMNIVSAYGKSKNKELRILSAVSPAEALARLAEANLMIVNITDDFWRAFAYKVIGDKRIPIIATSMCSEDCARIGTSEEKEFGYRIVLMPNVNGGMIVQCLDDLLEGIEYQMPSYSRN